MDEITKRCGLAGQSRAFFMINLQNHRTWLIADYYIMVWRLAKPMTWPPPLIISSAINVKP